MPMVTDDHVPRNPHYLDQHQEETTERQEEKRGSPWLTVVMVLVAVLVLVGLCEDS